jgi:acyl-CoA synthetase (AMP-forming)/AMP-acid ligase II
MSAPIVTAGQTALPLLAPRDLDAPLAWRGGVPVSARHFLADANRLAGTLPAAGPAINLCADRYAFAVGLAAALLRGQASLLPPDARPDTLARLHEGGSASFALTDDPSLATPGLARLLVELPVQPAGEAADEEPVPAIEAAHHAVSLLTSGSTGVPQAHAKRWSTLVGDVAAAVPRLSALLGRPSLEGLTLVATVPVQHSYGLESSVLLAMLGGAAFDSARPFFPADIAAALASVPRPRALVTTPFHLKTLLLSGIELPQVDFMLSATAPLSPQLAAQAEMALGGPMIEIYGSTETGQVATRRTTQTDVWETFGQIRVHAELQPQGGNAGERFIFEGDFVPEPTAMADVLELIDERHFRLLGRANDLIHVAGRRSSLGFLNYHLNSIPGVQDGAFWLPDDVADAVVRPVAFVVAPNLSSEAVIAALRQRLEAVFVPRRIVHVQALPREATGKLVVRTLHEFALAQLAADGDTVRLTRDVPHDHPSFAGHFPGQPLLPGALLLAEVQEAMAQVPALMARLGRDPSLAAAKFLAPIRPGAQLKIELVPDPGGAAGVRFEVREGEVLAASGRWVASGDAAQ